MTRNTTTFALLALAGTTGFAQAQVGNIGYVDWRMNYHWGDFTEIEIATMIQDRNNEHFLEDFASIAPGNGGIGRQFDGAGIAYFTSGTNGVPTDLVRVTTVYGLDLTPLENVPTLTGLDLSDALYEFVSLETIIGRSGAHYTSEPVKAVMLSDLGSVLPGKDLSWFESGDPSSHLYVFQTLAPLNEFYVPAPASAALLGFSGVLAARRSRR